MASEGQLSVNDRVLLHISRFAADPAPEEHSPECTQVGIANAVGISRTHVPRAVRSLIKDGLVEETRGRVSGRDRRMGVYLVTPEGLRHATEIWGGMLDLIFTLERDGDSTEVSGAELEEMVGRKRAFMAVSQSRDGILRLDGRGGKPVRDLDEAPEMPEAFFGRDSELEAIAEFMASDSKVLIILGNRGYGATTLALEHVRENDETSVLWTDLGIHADAETLKERMMGFAEKVRRGVTDPLDALDLRGCLLVFDEYYAVEEDLVELFATMATRVGASKVMIVARGETPAYSWFYQRKHVDSGLVTELRIRGLDRESAKKLLGNPEIDDDALKRVHSMTGGQPMALRMLREGDRKGLEANTVFTAEEIRYLLFLKDRRE